jgi:hypothetical protein
VEAVGTVDADAVARTLRRGRYRVERFREGETTYLFADRFAWAQLGTLLTHAAVIIFIVAAAISRMDAFSSPLFLSEGATLPVFPVRDVNQMQVELVDARAAFNEDGRPLDYRSELVIYLRGEEVKRCVSTVNSPCGYEGYRFSQAAYFGYGAGVQVRDLVTGNVIYRETLRLQDALPSPWVTIKDGDGQEVLNGSLVLTETLATEDFTYHGTLVTLPDDRVLTVGAERAAGSDDWLLAVFEPGEGDDVARLVLKEGETAEAGGLEVTYLRAAGVPAAVVSDLPLPSGLDRTGLTDPVLQMSNVVYGTARASEGTNVDTASLDGPPRLTLTGLQPQAVSLAEGESAIVDGFEYTFLGQREFAGIQVRKDRSGTLVWIGAALISAGLVVTFWVPRRRLWAKITLDRIWLAGRASGHADFSRELGRLARDAGGEMPEESEDDD